MWHTVTYRNEKLPSQAGGDSGVKKTKNTKPRHSGWACRGLIILSICAYLCRNQKAAPLDSDECRFFFPQAFASTSHDEQTCTYHNKISDGGWQDLYLCTHTTCKLNSVYCPTDVLKCVWNQPGCSTNSSTGRRKKSPLHLLLFSSEGIMRTRCSSPEDEFIFPPFRVFFSKSVLSCFRDKLCHSRCDRFALSCCLFVTQRVKVFRFLIAVASVLSAALNLKLVRVTYSLTYIHLKKWKKNIYVQYKL